MAEDKKISGLPQADLPLTGTELMEVVQGGVNKKVAKSDVSSGGGGTWGSITGTLSSQTDLQSALDAKAPLASPALTGTPTVNGESVSPGLEVLDTTGTAISFAVPQFYASAGTPATGNVTLVTTGLVKGMVQVLYHNNGTEPTFGAEFVRVSGFYITSTLNIIYMHAISTSRIEYMIFQEL